MKKILIMFLVLALTLSFCGSSLVFADEAEVLTLTVADALEDGEVEGDQIEIPQA